MRITLNLLGNTPKVFSFVDERAENSDFVSSFSTSYQMQKNYYHLERALEIPFGDSIVEGNFTIYNIDILSEEFMEALKLNMHNRWNSRLQESFDPILHPSFLESLVTQEDLERIESTLYAIFKAYGKRGLEAARGLNLAHAICDSSHYIALEDEEDKFDLEMSNGKKVLFLDSDLFDPITRSLQALGCDDFALYPNENVKSALFAMPYLLYRDDNMISAHEIRMLLREIEISMKQPVKRELDRDTYYEALRVARSLFVKYNEDLIPRRSSSKQYKVEE